MIMANKVALSLAAANSHGHWTFIVLDAARLDVANASFWPRAAEGVYDRERHIP
jgi:hypothetical protein